MTKQIGGGSSGLDNLGYPCAECNSIKGSLLPFEFLALLEFLEREIPLARKDILSRLQKAISLAAGAHFNSAVIGELKKTGQWQEAMAARNRFKKQKRG